jgi:hypothetical protein
VVDGNFTVVWEHVEKNVAEETVAMYGKSDVIDNRFLLKNGCER